MDVAWNFPFNKGRTLETLKELLQSRALLPPPLPTSHVIETSEQRWSGWQPAVRAAPAPVV